MMILSEAVKAGKNSPHLMPFLQRNERLLINGYGAPRRFPNEEGEYPEGHG